MQWLHQVLPVQAKPDAKLDWKPHKQKALTKNVQS